MNLLILVVDDEPDVELLFRQQFRRDLRVGRFAMEFAQSAHGALQRITDATNTSLILILSDVNMPGTDGLRSATDERAPACRLRSLQFRNRTRAAGERGGPRQPVRDGPCEGRTWG